MIRSPMLAGMSVIAFAASVSAQTTTTTNGDTTDANTGNRVVVSCTVGNNTCSVRQSAGTFDSTGSVNIDGSNSNSVVNQSGNRLLAENRATGDRNSAAVTQSGFTSTALVSQRGTIAEGNLANSALVIQGSSGSRPLGNNNVVEVAQTRTPGAAAADGGNTVDVRQADVGGGNNNYAASFQSGTNLLSRIRQTVPSSDFQGAKFNTATVSQSGAGSFSDVLQVTSGNVARVDLFGGNNINNNSPNGASTGANNSRLFQTNTRFRSGTSEGSFVDGNPSGPANTPLTANLAVVAISGLQNSSSVNQNGVQNTADVSILTGGAGNTALGAASGASNPGTGGSFPANRPEGNSSTIDQIGRGNYAAVSSGGRVTRSDGTMSGGAGNISGIFQTQSDANVTATTLNSAQTAATAHRALVYQRGTLDTVTIEQNTNSLGGASGNVVQSGSVADVSQLSFNSTARLRQSGTNTALITQGARNEATGADNGITIIQSDEGDVTTTTGANPGGGFGGGAAGTVSGSSRNFTEVVQYGIQNSTTVIQNAVAASATVFQAVGTRSNIAEIRQGRGLPNGGFSNEQDSANTAAGNTGANTQNVVASISQINGQAGIGTRTGFDGQPQFLGAVINQDGRNLFASITQQGGTATPAGTSTGGLNSSNSAVIAQANDRNSATVSQNGTNLLATIEQRGGAATAGAGAGGGASAATGAGFNNLVTVTQTNVANQALARQTAGVGNSDANGATSGVPNDVNFPFSRSGAASAEIVISQSGVGGSATVEQRGRGQYASITQSGTNNVGGILQNAGATNAVAVLTQNGTNNTYYITQDTAGQYIRVTQTGTGNTTAGTSIINGPSGSGNSNANPQARPAFGGVQ